MPYSVDRFPTSEALQALGRFLQLTASLAARSEGGEYQHRLRLLA